MTHLSIETLLLAGSSLLLLSIFASKISGKFGIPALLIFLAVGMLAGSDGIGGIHFNNASLAKSLGTVALILILFSGGVDTEWSTLHRVWKRGVALSTLGVLTSTILVGGFMAVVFHFSWLEGLLLGAIVSSTDAAAVFSVLKSRSVSLKRQLRPLLEFESGSNDPMAVFLTIGFIHLIQNPALFWMSLIPEFLWQMAVGGLLGYGVGLSMVFIINRLKLEYEGLYPVLTLSMVLFTFGLTAALRGNGFLAVYVAGLMMSNRDFVYKKSLVRFHDGLAWLMQIAMFVTLGLLVFPSRLMPILGIGLLVSLFVMFVARPLSVYISLLFARMSFNEKTMISWVGLRGAAPIILATFALIAEIPKANLIFNIVFFIVLTSVLFQGSLIPYIAKALNVDTPFEKKKRYPIEFEHIHGTDTDLLDFLIPFNAQVAGKSIAELNLPPDSLITLVCRNEDFVVASGKTILEEGDVVLALVNQSNSPLVQSILSKQKNSKGS
jgi:potassium/hydrogen antiporter